MISLFLTRNEERLFSLILLKNTVSVLEQNSGMNKVQKSKFDCIYLNILYL